MPCSPSSAKAATGAANNPNSITAANKHFCARIVFTFSAACQEISLTRPAKTAAYPFKLAIGLDRKILG
ncbi:MAG: hypothetical protein Alpg2KO_05630 [Alphaproteobacteria bacterium]